MDELELNGITLEAEAYFGLRGEISRLMVPLEGKEELIEFRKKH